MPGAGQRPNFLIINHSITRLNRIPSRCLPCGAQGLCGAKTEAGGGLLLAQDTPGVCRLLDAQPHLSSPSLLFRILSFPVVWLSLPSSCCASPGWGTGFPQHSSPSQKHGMEPRRK